MQQILSLQLRTLEHTTRIKFIAYIDGTKHCAMAVINNLIVGLIPHMGRVNFLAARRYYAAYPREAQRLIFLRPSRLGRALIPFGTIGRV